MVVVLKIVLTGLVGPFTLDTLCIQNFNRVLYPTPLSTLKCVTGEAESGSGKVWSGHLPHSSAGPLTFSPARRTHQCLHVLVPWAERPPWWQCRAPPPRALAGSPSGPPGCLWVATALCTLLHMFPVDRSHCGYAADSDRHVWSWYIALHESCCIKSHYYLSYETHQGVSKILSSNDFLISEQERHSLLHQGQWHGPNLPLLTYLILYMFPSGQSRSLRAIVCGRPCWGEPPGWLMSSEGMHREPSGQPARIISCWYPVRGRGMVSQGKEKQESCHSENSLFVTVYWSSPSRWCTGCFLHEGKQKGMCVSAEYPTR